eukprot:353511-Chlamydomonas_euryale.AAC.1
MLCKSAVQCKSVFAVQIRRVVQIPFAHRMRAPTSPLCTCSADGHGSDPIQALCRADLTVADFFTNDLGRFTPCFIDLAVLGASAMCVEKHAPQVSGNMRIVC